jgi:hypothetical protein
MTGSGVGGKATVGEEAGRPLEDAPELCPTAAQAVAYWNGIRPAPDLLPGRRHFDPLDIHKLMPHVWLIDVLRDPDDAAAPLRFRCRLYGTGLVTAFGQDLTGRDLEEPDIGFAGSAAEADFRRIAAEGIGLWWRGPIAMRKRRHVSAVEVVMLPMAADGRTVDLVFCAVEVVRRI